MKIYDSGVGSQTNSAATLVVSEATRPVLERLMTALGEVSHDIVVKAGAINSEQVIEQVAQHSPSVVLISASLEDGATTGFRALRNVHMRFSHTRPIMLLDGGDREQVVTAFRAGAKGVLFRTDPIASVVKAIWSVHQGQIWAPNAELECTLEALTWRMSPEIDKKETTLTNREEQVLNLIAQGNSDFEIAQHLMVSQQAVKDHISRMFDKLELSSRVELILFAHDREQFRGQKDTPSASAD